MVQAKNLWSKIVMESHTNFYALYFQDTHLILKAVKKKKLLYRSNMLKNKRERYLCGDFDFHLSFMRIV